MGSDTQFDAWFPLALAVSACRRAWVTLRFGAQQVEKRTNVSLDVCGMRAERCGDHRKRLAVEQQLEELLVLSVDPLQHDSLVIRPYGVEEQPAIVDRANRGDQ